jgi:hypothetical protein
MPSIFDALAHPDIIMPLVLANLLSPELWRLSDQVFERAKRAPDAEPHVSPLLRAAQHQVDRHFEHLSMTRTAEVFGELDLTQEAARLGGALVEEAVTRILTNVEKRVREDGLDTRAIEYLHEAVRRRRFPAYHYSHFDVVRANRRLAEKRKKVPKGLTSCLDEVAIFCALVLTLPEDVVETVVVLASPEHYTAFGWNEAQEPWWFYGKNHLYSSHDWHALVAQDHDGDPQLAFDRRLGQVDRIVTIRGSWYLETGESSLPSDRRHAIVGALDRFFGTRLRQVDAALAKQKAPKAPSDFETLFLSLKATRSRAEARERFQVLGDFRKNEALSLVAYNYRTLAVSDLSPYLAAARRGAAVRDLGASLASVDAAMDYVRALPSRESIFQDRNRMAMPEETLRFQTGTDRDCALLLHVLLEALPEPARPRGPVDTVFCEEDSYVLFDDVAVRMSDVSRIARGSDAGLLESTLALGRSLAPPHPQAP